MSEHASLDFWQLKILSLVPKFENHSRYTALLSKMFFTPVFEYEISDIISNLKNSTSMEHDNLPISLLKSCNLELSPILAHLTNESLSSGVFPDTLKIAKVIPVFKSWR